MNIPKSLRDLVIGASAALSLLAPGCNVGERVRADADGVLSAEEKTEMLNLFTSRVPIGDLSLVQNLVNDIDVFLGNEFVAKGYRNRRIGYNLRLELVDNTEELAAAYELRGTVFDLFSPKMPEYTAAFEREPGSTIFMLNDHPLKTWLNIYHHELGHYFELGKKEMTAEMNRAYTFLKMMKFDYAFGSIMLDIAVTDFTPPRVYLDHRLHVLPMEGLTNEDIKNIEETLVYPISELNAIMLINKFGGDLERAYYEIDKASYHTLKKDFFETYASYGKDLFEVWGAECLKLLDNKNLRGDLLAVLTGEQVNEASAYLKFNTITQMMLVDFYSGNDVSSYVSTLEMLASAFFDSTSTANPYFYAKVVKRYSDVLDIQYHLKELAITVSEEMIPLETKIELLDLAKKVIEINRFYPCEGDYFTCPSEMADVRELHLESYARTVNWLDNLAATGDADPAEIIGLGNEYLRKFFPSGFKYETYFTTTAMKAFEYLPAIGSTFLTNATLLANASSGRESLGLRCDAETMASAMLEASCGNVENDYARGVCREKIPDDASDVAAAAYAEFAGSCDAYFSVPMPYRP